MLITDDFVLLNYPKTGSTFCRKVIQAIYKDDFEELLFPVAYDWRYLGKNTQHGTYAQIPKKYRGRPVLSIMRNPFDRAVSQFHFKWYAQSPPAPKHVLRKFYPGFPEISFAEFLDMGERFSKRNILAAYGIFQETEIGFQTVSFVSFFSDKPKKDLKDLITSDKNPFERLPEVHFLRQERLRDDLGEYVSQVSQRRDVEHLIAEAKDINVSRTSREKDYMQFWPDELLGKFCGAERHLLDAFPDYRPGKMDNIQKSLIDVPSEMEEISHFGGSVALNPMTVRMTSFVLAVMNYCINKYVEARIAIRHFLRACYRRLRGVRHALGRVQE